MSKLDRLYRGIVISKFFKSGWGSPNLLHKIVTNHHNYYRSRTNFLNQFAYPLPEFRVEKIRETNNYQTYNVRFRTSFWNWWIDEIENDVVDIADVEMVVPKTVNKNEDMNIIIHLAGTGDHYSWRRRLMYALPLVSKGNYVSMILENPFYGRRKPKNQLRSALNKISDLFLMGGALATEVYHLIQWTKRYGLFEGMNLKFCVTGASMGGHMAAVSSTFLPEPVICIPFLTWSSASLVFTHGVMSTSLPWKVLEKELMENFDEYDKKVFQYFSDIPGAVNDNNISETRRILMKLLDETTFVGHYPQPFDDKNNCVVTAEYDAYVPRFHFIPPLVPKPKKILRNKTKDLKGMISNAFDNTIVKKEMNNSNDYIVWPNASHLQMVNQGHVSSIMNYADIYRTIIMNRMNYLSVSN